MVGGTVVETITMHEKVWINTREENTGDECAIYVENSPKACSVSEGDIVWWQSDRAYWTAKDRQSKTIGKPDTILKRIGFSGVSRPK